MCRLEKFHLPLRPNLKDWNMMTLNKKWMRLMVLVGCAALTASCKQAPVGICGIKGITVGQSFVYYLFGYDPWPPGY